MILKQATTKEELEQVYAIRQTVFVVEQNCPPEEEFDAYEDKSVHFLLLEDKEPMGAARLRDYNGVAKLERICVLKNKRKSGAGKTIVLGMEDYAKAKGYTSFFLNAQEQAIGFYEKLGYEVCSESFMDAGIPHRSMKKTI